MKGWDAIGDPADSLDQAFGVFPVGRDHTDPDELVHVFLPDVLRLTTDGLPAICRRLQGPEVDPQPSGRLFNSVQAKASFGWLSWKPKCSPGYI